MSRSARHEAAERDTIKGLVRTPSRRAGEGPPFARKVEMTFVVLAHGASARSCSIVHSHQDSFGHELQVAAVPDRLRSGDGPLPVVCACGWTGALPVRDVEADSLVGQAGGPALLMAHASSR